MTATEKEDRAMTAQAATPPMPVNKRRGFIAAGFSGAALIIGLILGVVPVHHDCGSVFHPADEVAQLTDSMVGGSYFADACTQARHTLEIPVWALIILGVVGLVVALIIGQSRSAGQANKEGTS
ncbi:MAG: hypothetical protein ACRDP6_47195 [Actinoallomurus sp.]